LYNT